MEVRIDDNAGYCFGVVKAIGAAEAELAHSGELYCLGDIVHNSAEVERLKREGLCVIDHDQLRQLHGCRVLIRAHGEPPDTYSAARERDITLIDATCPIVLALQDRIRRGCEEMRACNGQIVIFGKPGHAEVTGLNGQTGGTAIIVSREDELDQIDFQRPLRLYSQTTKSREEYRRLIANIEARLPEGADFVAYDTICNRVANRARQLEAFAVSVDVLLFVAGANSSNGHYLYEYCRKVQPNTHLIGGPDEVCPEWVTGVSSVGISGATSTPRWLMEEVAEQLRVKS
ncbi:MAG: 4-hydroxy-3-methylbut-2-enyl diphosphate reductase [Bacteroidales bacterium]|nr:4-hydroxy-3-methylbut-2-enyl diphosphate reductase [Bacteroidales bacterium]